MKAKILFICFMMMNMITSITSQEEIVVTIGNYPPFSYEEGFEDNPNSGLFIDFIEAFEKKHPEYKFSLVHLPRKRMDTWMDTGQASIFFLNNPMFNSPERNERFLYSLPIWRTGDYLITQKGKSIQFDKVDDLFTIKLGVIFGNSYNFPEYPLDDLIEQGKIQVELPRNLKKAIEMLVKNRVDAIIGNLHGFPKSCSDLGYSLSDFEFSENGLFEFDLMMQINKQQVDLCNKFNTFITEIKENGDMKRMEEKYLK